MAAYESATCIPVTASALEQTEKGATTAQLSQPLRTNQTQPDSSRRPLPFICLVMVLLGSSQCCKERRTGQFMNLSAHGPSWGLGIALQVQELQAFPDFFGFLGRICNTFPGSTQQLLTQVLNADTFWSLTTSFTLHSFRQTSSQNLAEANAAPLDLYLLEHSSHPSPHRCVRQV